VGVTRAFFCVMQTPDRRNLQQGAAVLPDLTAFKPRKSLMVS
jgi:hypothetical protein